MRFTVILSFCVFVTSHHGHAAENEKRQIDDDDCNQENKQKSLYLKNYYEPSLDSDPATEISTTIMATLGDHPHTTSALKGERGCTKRRCNEGG